MQASSIRALLHVLVSQLGHECRQLLIRHGRMWPAHLAFPFRLREQVFKATLPGHPVLSVAVSGRRGGRERLRHCFDGQVCDEMPKGVAVLWSAIPLCVKVSNEFIRGFPGSSARPLFEGGGVV